MAPVALTQEAEILHKRKRDDDDQIKKKRARHRNRSSDQAPIDEAEPSNDDVEISKPDVKPAIAEPADEPVLAGTTRLAVSRGKGKRRGKKDRKGAHQAVTEFEDDWARSEWTVSKPVGGRMVDVDPILSKDEEHLILAYTTSVQVYSTAESLLVRKISLPLLQRTATLETVVAMRISRVSPNLLWVASSKGNVWMIDWTTGDGAENPSRIKCENLGDMTVEAVKIHNKVQDVVFMSCSNQEIWRLCACDIRAHQLHAMNILATQKHPILNIQSLRLGIGLAASSGSNLVLGALRAGNCKNFTELLYDTYVLDTADEITCLDIRSSDRVHLTERSQKEKGDLPIIDVVVGCARGAIYFYNDLLAQLRSSGGMAKTKSQSSTLQPQKYHWHRKAVHAVKWSRDGNYMISGGSESVLVLWQIDTGKKDVLPHLAATIENIVISERGSSYILHLDDNSAMILSTAEMKPATYVAGIQSLVSPPPPSKDNTVRRVGNKQLRTLIPNTSAAISPLDPTRALICVGNGQQLSQSDHAASTPLVQMLDLTTMQGLGKQAITRTNPTDVNMTGKGHTITEPRVTHLTYSSDGKWLATLDEWQPPSRDVGSLAGQSGERREVYLKFWSAVMRGSAAKDERSTEQSLELVSRIDSPHYGGRSERVLDLKADPSCCRFATVGEDGVVRLWQPAIRQRDGIVIKSRSGRQLESWACTQSIQLHEPKAPLDAQNSSATTYTSKSGAIAFSEDGSVLACAMNIGDQAAVYIIQSDTGEVIHTLDGLVHGEIHGVCVHSSHVVVLADDLVVYNIVMDELEFGIQIKQDVDATTPSPQLAIDHTSGAFAVALTRNVDGADTVNELAVFAIGHHEPSLVRKFPHPIVSLIATADSSGFVVLDAVAQIWSISRGIDAQSLSIARPLADISLEQNGHNDDAGAAAVDDDDKVAVVMANEPADDASDIADDMDLDMDEQQPAEGDDDAAYPVVVAPQKLAELFDAAPAFAMPPVEDMFYKVAKLFSTRPQTTGST